MTLLSILLVGLNQLMSHPSDSRVSLTLMIMMVTSQAPVRGHALSPTGSMTRNGRRLSSGCITMKLLMVHFAVYAKMDSSSLNSKGFGRCLGDKPFTNWEKAIEKMKSHNASQLHLDSCQAALMSSQAQRHETVAQQL